MECEMETMLKDANDLRDELANLATKDDEGDNVAVAPVRISRHTISEIKDIIKFMYAGNSTFTIQNTETCNRFTYKLQVPQNKRNAPEHEKVWFVKVMTGSNNEGDYQFVGTIFNDQNKYPNKYYRHSAKSRITNQAQSVKVFQWFLKALQANNIPSQVEFYHEGRCGRCGRKLTVPESIIDGIGPECAKMVF